MTDITRHTFVAELEKLLAFMYEEDRYTAISMYERMFDDAEDEGQLAADLISPTRQAVVLARVYDARARKAELKSQYSNDEEPAFVSVISDLYDDLVGAPLPRRPLKPAKAEAPAPAPAAPVTPEPPKAAAPAEEGAYKTRAVVYEPAEDGGTAPPAPVTPDFSLDEEEKEADTPESEPQEKSESVEAASEEAGPAPAPAPEPEPEPAAPDRSEDAWKSGDFQSDVIIPVHQPAAPAPAFYAPPVKAAAKPAERKAIIPLLILYAIVAIPVTAALIILLLVPTVAFAALAGLVSVLGVFLITMTFGGFSFFADVLVVLGTALVLLALAVLFLWLFIWMLGAVVPGLVRSVMRLGNKACYREVEG